jgi:anti-sigma factor RsiW
MQRRSDDRLVAYLDGELDAAQRREIEAWLDADPAARLLLAEFAQSAELIRHAFDEVLHEPLPPRLIAAARGGTVRDESRANENAPRLLRLAPRTGARRPTLLRRWRLGLPVAASIVGLLAGGGAGYFGVGEFASGITADNAGQPAMQAAIANNMWLDNAAGYFKLFVSAGDNALVDVPVGGDPRQALQKISQSLTQQVRLPDLKPWGLNFRGARLIVVDGRPAAQLVYTTDNKAIGPLALIIGSSKQPDISPTFDRRQDVNLIYWRHQGHAYALVGEANVGYLWGIGNDVAWQLDAI